MGKWYDNCLDALTVEALACQNGMVHTRQPGATKICMETDCQEQVKLLSQGVNQCSIVAIFREIQELSMFFQEFTLLFTSRECNRAHLPAIKQVTVDAREGLWQTAPA